MNWFVKFFNNKSIRFKLLTNYIIIISVIITILSIINSINITNELENVFNKNTAQMIRQIKNNVEFYIKDIDNIIYYLSEDKNVKQYLLEEDIEESYNYEKEILELLKLYTSAHSEIGGILIANQRGEFISNDMITISSEPLIEDNWYKRAINNTGKIQLISKPIKRNVKSIYDYYSADNMVSLVKSIEYSENGITKQGVVLVDLKINSIGYVISENKFNENEFFYILDESNQIIFSPVNKIVYRINAEWFNQTENKNNMFVQKIGDKSYQILYEYSEYTNCNFVGVFSLSQSLKIINDIQKNTLIYAAILLMIGIGAAIVYTNSIIKPIGILQGLMKKAEEGELDIEYPVIYNDEIGQLGNSFNSMIESIKNLLNLVYVEQQQKKEAELKAFQAQIKPHFLYNTLDTINWMAQEYNADDISEIVCALTNLFRISLSKGKEIITLKEEIKQVESYLIIQLARYSGKFTYSINYNNELLNCKVIKLVLQPMVENAIYHGIKEKDGPGHINIHISKNEDMLIYKIQDNGLGMPDSKVEEINKMLINKEPISEKYGIGIFNVNERIKLTYGYQYGIKIKSEMGKGTTVLIVQPLIIE